MPSSTDEASMSTESRRLFRSVLPAPPAEPSVVVQALRHAASDPDRLAVVDSSTGERFSRGEITERSAALAAGLARRGIGRGDVVALAMPNIAWWPVVALGVWRAGAALAPLNPVWGAEEMGRVLSLLRPRLAVASEPAAASVKGALSTAEIGADVVVHGAQVGTTPLTPLEGLLAGGVHPFAEPDLEPDDLAVVPFSSGLAGLPKAVRLTHGNLSAASAQVVASLELASDSVALAGAPVCNAMGLVSSLTTPLSAGAAIVTVPVPSAEPILDAISEHGVTHATVPLTVIADVAADPQVTHDRDSRLQHVVTGGAHVPAEQQLLASEYLAGLVRQAYGMTEALVISSTTARASDPETVGWLAAGTEARLLDPETGRDAKADQPGELWIRGPQVMDGYHDDPDATAATMTADGWLRTGDLVRIRDDGQLVIEDRLKELIKVKGASVSPAELELVLREHPAVRDAVVVGRPDDRRGEVPVAWVIPSGSATPQELIAFVRSRVAAHKRLHDVRTVDELPRAPSPEHLRRALRERERDAAARAGQ